VPAAYRTALRGYFELLRDPMGIDTASVDASAAGMPFGYYLFRTHAPTRALQPPNYTDGNGNIVGPVVSGGALFSGYQQDQVATQRALVDGWLDTGDRGYVADGHLYFVSREKDLIVIGGDKYSPQDVEMAIDEVPGVRRGCAVAFGILNAQRGTEEVAAVVETREEDPERLECLARATGLGIRHLKLVRGL